MFTMHFSIGAPGPFHLLFFVFKNVTSFSLENWHPVLVLSFCFYLRNRSGKEPCVCEVESFLNLDFKSQVQVPVLPLLNSMTWDRSFHFTAGGSSICMTELRKPGLPNSESSSESPVRLSTLWRPCGIIITALMCYISHHYLENWY